MSTEAPKTIEGTVKQVFTNMREDLGKRQAAATTAIAQGAEAEVQKRQADAAAAEKLKTDQAAADAKLVADKQAADAAAAAAKVAADAAAAAAAKPADAPADGGEKQTATLKFKATGVDEPLGVIYGIAATTDIDDENESLTQKALTKMAFDYTARKTRETMANHASDCDFELVASMPGSPVYDAKGGVFIDPLGPRTHWFVGVRPKDPAVFAAAKAGEIAGFSWGGFTKKSPRK